MTHRETIQERADRIINADVYDAIINSYGTTSVLELFAGIPSWWVDSWRNAIGERIAYEHLMLSGIDYRGRGFLDHSDFTISAKETCMQFLEHVDNVASISAKNRPCAFLLTINEYPAETLCEWDALGYSMSEALMLLNDNWRTVDEVETYLAHGIDLSLVESMTT
jgi:hypothetical protein